MWRIFVDPYRKSTRTRELRGNIRTEHLARVDFSKEVSVRPGATAVSSVAWTSVGPQTVTITGKTATAAQTDVYEAYLQSDYGGRGEVRCEATLDDGNTVSVYLRIFFEDPERR